MERSERCPRRRSTGPALGPGRFATNYGEAVLFGAMHVTHALRPALDHPPQPRQAAAGVSVTRTS